MKLVAAIYLSNQDIIGYPVDYVAATLDFVDEIHLFGGDQANTDWLAALKERHPLGAKMFVDCIDQKVETVGDIPAMMTKSVARLKGRADFVLVTQADTCATPESVQVVRSYMTDQNRVMAAHLYCRIGFLYQHSGTGWGHTIVGGEFAGRFDGDGFGFDAEGHHIGRVGDGWNCCLEIGSLSPELYFRHQSSHVKTWREYGLMGPRLAAYPGAIARDPLLAPWLQTRVDRDEFLRLSLMDGRNRIVNTPLVPIESVDARFTKVIEDMGLRDDCTYVCGLVKKHRFDK